MSKGTLSSWTIGWIWSFIYLIAVITGITTIIMYNTIAEVDTTHAQMQLLTARILTDPALIYIDPITNRPSIGVIDAEKLGLRNLEEELLNHIRYSKPESIAAEITIENHVFYYNKDWFRRYIEQISIPGPGGIHYNITTVPVIIRDRTDRIADATIKVVKPA